VLYPYNNVLFLSPQPEIASMGHIFFFNQEAATQESIKQVPCSSHPDI